MRLLSMLVVFSLFVPGLTQDMKEERKSKRPKLAGKLRLQLRERKETAPGSGKWKIVKKNIDWEVSQTAIIICDMWDDHYCKSAAQRVGVMAPRMNEVLTAARNHGVMIIHAPSGTLDQYEGTVYRKRMQQAKAAKAPVPLLSWCH